MRLRLGNEERRAPASEWGCDEIGIADRQSISKTESLRLEVGMDYRYVGENEPRQAIGDFNDLKVEPIELLDKLVVVLRDASESCFLVEKSLFCVLNDEIVQFAVLWIAPEFCREPLDQALVVSQLADDPGERIVVDGISKIHERSRS